MNSKTGTKFSASSDEQEAVSWPDNYQCSCLELAISHCWRLHYLSWGRQQLLAGLQKPPPTTAPAGIHRSWWAKQSASGSSKLLEPMLQVLKFFLFTLSINTVDYINKSINKTILLQFSVFNSPHSCLSLNKHKQSPYLDEAAVVRGACSVRSPSPQLSW